jgi:hypothetical protein
MCWSVCFAYCDSLLGLYNIGAFVVLNVSLYKCIGSSDGEEILFCLKFGVDFAAFGPELVGNEYQYVGFSQHLLYTSLTYVNIKVYFLFPGLSLCSRAPFCPSLLLQLHVFIS